MNTQKPREIAAQLLRQRDSSEYIEDRFERALAGKPLSRADRGLCLELVYGVTRWQRTLDWLIARKTGGRAQNATLAALLRMGLYQIFWLERIPDHAAVHQTVELGRQFGFGPQTGFLNATLRGYLREREATERALADLKRSEPAVGYSHPDWLVERWTARWGAEKTIAFLQWNNTAPASFARVNTLKTDAAALAKIWAAEGVEAAARSWPWTGEGLVFELERHASLATTASFQQGLFYVQDPSTLLAVFELEPQPGETILDLCAAPGGKTTFIAQRMGDRGKIVAADAQPPRLRQIEENCARLGVKCVQTASPSAAAGPFDRVLVDAPCSNTGVLRRRLEARWRLQPEQSSRLRQIQLGLLAQAAALLKPGGTLVYSTCSVEPEENEALVAEFLQKPGFTLEREQRLLPFADGVDGAYSARLRKN